MPMINGSQTGICPLFRYATSNVSTEGESLLVPAAEPTVAPNGSNPRVVARAERERSALDKLLAGDKGTERAMLWSVSAGQALVSFVENGILASVLPNTLVPYTGSWQ